MYQNPLLQQQQQSGYALPPMAPASNSGAFGQQQQQQQQQGPPYEQLARELKESHANLAEVLDEVLFFERQSNERQAALSSVRSQFGLLCESTISVLGYVSLLENRIILPALGDAQTVLQHADSSGRTKREEGPRGMDRVVQSASKSDGDNDNRQQMTRLEKMLHLLRNGSTGKERDAAKQRDDIVQATGGRDDAGRSGSDTDVASLEDVYVLTQALAREREGLAALLTDARDRMALLAGEIDSTHAASEGQSGKGGVLEAQLERKVVALERSSQETKKLLETKLDTVTIERDALQAEVERLKSENNRLMRSGSGGSMPVVQNNKELGQRFQVLHEALQRSEAEKTALVEQVQVLNAQLNSGSTGHYSPTHLSKSASAPGTPANSNMVAVLNETLEKQRKEILQLREEGARLRHELSSFRGGAMAAGGTGSAAVVANVELQTKLQAFEITTEELNKELAVMEEKLFQLEKQHEAELSKLKREMAEERRQNETERQECDDVVRKLTEELEVLIAENNDLRAQGGSR